MKALISKVKEAKPKVKALISKVKEAKPKVKALISKVKEAKPKVKALISKVKEAKPKVKALISKVKEAKPKAKKTKAKSLVSKAKTLISKVKGVKPKIKTLISKAKTILPKINGLKLYGNFCGPNYCGGQKFKGAEGPKCQWGVAPKDSLDSCCKLHDQCCGSSNTRGKRCNQEILSCLKNVKCDGPKCKVAQSIMKMTFATMKNKVCGDVLGKSAAKAKANDKVKAKAKDPMNKPTVIKVASVAVSADAPDAADAPVAVADAPVAVADAPVADAPVAVADAPVAVADAPVAVADAPVSADAPVVVADAPVADAPVADAPVADAPVADAPVAVADAPVAVADAPVAARGDDDSPVAKDQAVDEIIKSIPKTNMKLKQFQEKLMTFITETNNEQKKIETENRNNYNGVSVTLQNEQLRLESARKSMKTLYAETEHLNITIQTHYKKLIADTSYLESLDAIRPSFLKSLGELASHIAAVKSIVDEKIYKDEYKDEMIGLLTDIHFTTHNVSGYVAAAFINHYNKYKALIDKENVDYSSELKRLTVLSNSYKVQAQKFADMNKERARIQGILDKLKATLTLSISQREEFDRLVKDVVTIFDKKCGVSAPPTTAELRSITQG